MVSHLAAAGTVLALAAALRPRSVRVLVVPHRVALSSSLGRAIRRRLGRPADDARDRWVGAVLVWGGVGVVVLGPAGVALGVARGVVPVVAARRRSQHEAQRRWAELPESADLVALCLSAGLSVPASVDLVGGVLGGPVAESLRRVRARHRSGVVFGDAVGREIQLAHDDLQGLLTLLGAAHVDGGPAIEPFRRLGRELAQRRRQRAEAAARRVPVVMLFPLVCCILPAFVLLALVPVLVGSLDGLAVP